MNIPGFSVSRDDMERAQCIMGIRDLCHLELGPARLVLRQEQERWKVYYQKLGSVLDQIEQKRRASLL